MKLAGRTTDAVEILHRLFVGDDLAKQAMLDEFRADMEIAAKIVALRTAAGLTQRQLAARVGTTASVICRLEDADYKGHSLAMLNRIAAALGKRVKMEFVPMTKRKSA
jgi:DNA-binding XRE family transcriptional regulator